MGFMDTLFGGTPEVTLPPALKAEIEQLQYMPFGPQRDALQAKIQQTYGLSNDQFNTALQGLDQVMTGAEGTFQSAGNQLAGLSNQLQNYGAHDPYMDFYSNPAAREQAYLAALKEANAAAFNPYGSQGGASQMTQGLLTADAAQRGITNSGIARRQMEQEQQRYAAARAEADGKALGTVRQQGIAEAGAYNAAKSGAGNYLANAGQLQGQRAQIAQYAPQQRMDAAKLYGNTALETSNSLMQAMSEERAARQDIENYNTQTQNKVNQDWTSSENQRNAQQGTLDASRRKAGIMDIIAPIASLGMQAAGAFGGMGGGAGATRNTLNSLGNTTMNSMNSMPQAASGPSFDMPRYNAPMPSNYNPWQNQMRSHSFGGAF